LLDAIVVAKPERDHTRFHSYDELRHHTVELVQAAVATLEGKATADEVEDYKQFVLTLARRVAERHEEHGTQISPAEQSAIDELAAALGAGQQ